METLGNPLETPSICNGNPLRVCIWALTVCHWQSLGTQTCSLRDSFAVSLVYVRFIVFVNKQCLIPTFCPGLSFSVQDEMFGIKGSQAAGVRLNALHVQECLCTGLVLSRFGILMCALMSSYSFWSSLDRPVHGCFPVPFCMVDDRRPATDDQRPTTNDGGRTTDDRRPTTDDARRTTDGRSTDDGRTTDGRRIDDGRTTDGGRRTTDDGRRRTTTDDDG